MDASLKNFIYATRNVVKSFLPRPDAASVLMYHSVGKEKVYFNVNPAMFETQLKLLKTLDCTVVSISHLLSLIEQDKPLKGAVALTFDDCYPDFYHTAFPLLKKYGIPATIFAIPGLVGKSLRLSTGQELKLLGWPELRKLSKSPLIEIGSHGMNHFELTKLSEADVEYELSESKKILEKKLGKKVRFFSYPRGKYNSQVARLVSKYYEAAFTVEEGLVRHNSDASLLCRNSIDSTTNLQQFKGKVLYGGV